MWQSHLHPAFTKRKSFAVAGRLVENRVQAIPLLLRGRTI